ncbi:hypothetical protein [Oerskovia sp. KBS0722]|uniref:hypothetical protein n=1 Tax=Oerskovia sp. KBS0722 TaxID=1179673 RepID=UPI00110EBDE9|nr:hypothetical protein [Oerskovia sp. KBS0722]QDW62221.1 hypothetical protein FFI11_006440 [Oerskovia sp. KBS0722]
MPADAGRGTDAQGSDMARTRYEVLGVLLVLGLSVGCTPSADDPSPTPSSTTPSGGTTIVDVETPVSGPPTAPLPEGEPFDPSQATVVGYEGWWNTSAARGADGQQATNYAALALVSTRTGQLVQVHDRAGVLPDDYLAPVDPAWPTDSVVVLDAVSGKVVDSFPVDENGWSAAD